jgi:FAD/FMN-containing dehydrogenase
VVADLLCAGRRPPTDAFEERLLRLSDRSYSVVVQVLRAQFVPDVFPNQTLAVSAMTTLDDANRLLVQRGLLPPFSPA